jgi:hypothetical protein
LSSAKDSFQVLRHMDYGDAWLERLKAGQELELP